MSCDLTYMVGDLLLSLKEMIFLAYLEVNVTISDARGKLNPSSEYLQAGHPSFLLAIIMEVVLLSLLCPQSTVMSRAIRPEAVTRCALQLNARVPRDTEQIQPPEPQASTCSDASDNLQ